MSSGPDFRALFEGAPDPYLVLSPDLRIVAVNDAYLQATLTTREAIVGRGLFEVFPDDPADPAADGVRNLRASLARVLAERAPDTMAVQRYAIRRPDGGFEERHWSPRNSPVLGPEGELQAVIHRVVDVTELVRLERRAALVDEAQREVMLRGQELQHANERLREATQRLHELDRLRARSFAHVSHELRTPLALILGPLERWLDEERLPDGLRADLRVARRNAQALRRHVDDLLDMAKLEAGELRARRSEVDLARVVRVVAAHFESLAQERRVLFAVEAPASLPARVDGEKLERVLLTLLANAFELTPDLGRVRVTLAERGDRALLVVADSGPGVEGERGFDRSAPRTDDGRGAGVGLHIARALVELHGGRVDVVEADEGGAAYAVDLPLGRDEPLAPDAPRGALADTARRAVEGLRRRGETSPEPAAEGGAGSLVLVVEDNPDMRRFLREALSGEHRVETACDGQQGLDRARALRPDLVITDVMMPRMNGDELVRALRADPALDATPALVLSARADEEQRVESLRSGAQDYLVKPFSVRELRARVRNLVAGKQAREVLQRESEVRRRDLDALVGKVTTGERQLEVALAEARDARAREALAEAERSRAVGALAEREEELRQAHKLEAVGRLAGGIAHDFNNLLTAILGYCDLLLSRLRGDEDRDDVREVQRAGKRAAGLVQQLLAFSRKQVLQPRVLDIARVVCELEPLLRRLVPESIDLTVASAPDSGRALADPTQLEQVILNLVVNARDAMPDGGRLTIATANVELDARYAADHVDVRPGPHVLLAVADTGTGLSPEVLDHLFEPFFTTKPPGKGTGLGLSTVYGIVKQSGGHVRASSRPGLGTTFEVYLPRVDGAAVVDPASSGPLATAPSGTETVLVVEDDPALRKLTALVLRRAGYVVLAAKDAEDALALADAHPGALHLLVTDVCLPGLSGPRLHEALARRRRSIRVLYVSGYSADSVPDVDLPPGTPFLQKPYSSLSLVRETRVVLDAAQAPAAP